MSSTRFRSSVLNFSVKLKCILYRRVGFVFRLEIRRWREKVAAVAKSAAGWVCFVAGSAMLRLKPRLTKKFRADEMRSRRLAIHRRLAKIFAASRDLDGTLVDVLTVLRRAVRGMLELLPMQSEKTRYAQLVATAQGIILTEAHVAGRVGCATQRKTMGKPPVDDVFSGRTGACLRKLLKSFYYGEVAEERDVFVHFVPLGALQAKSAANLSHQTNRRRSVAHIEAPDILIAGVKRCVGDDVQKTKPRLGYVLAGG